MGKRERLNKSGILSHRDTGVGSSHCPGEALCPAEEMVEVERRREKNHAHDETKINVVMIGIVFCFLT